MAVGSPSRSCAWCITLPLWLLPSHQRTKGCLCQAWLIWFLLMSYLPFFSATIHTLLPIPHVVNSRLWFRDYTKFFCICTCTHTVQGSCPTPVSAGASLKRAMYSPRVDETRRHTFILTWVPLSPPQAIYTVEKVNCLKHQQCYFSWFQKHCIWY